MRTANGEQKTNRRRGPKPNPEGRGAVVRVVPAALVLMAKEIAEARGPGWTAGRVWRVAAESYIRREHAKLRGLTE
jgi:hypothetical protein